MWISLADSIHKIILIIVKIFDIKSSLPRTPTLQSLSSSFISCCIFKFVFIHYSVHSQPCSLPVTVICIYLEQFYTSFWTPSLHIPIVWSIQAPLILPPFLCGHFICVCGLQLSLAAYLPDHPASLSFPSKLSFLILN